MDYTRAARKMAHECPAMKMRQATRIMGAYFDEALRPLGLQLSQLPLLCAAALHGEEGASMSQLARVLVLDPTTLTRNVRPLERTGLLRVARSPHDARARVVFLTPAGQRMIERAYPVWLEALKSVQRTFGAARIKDLGAQLAEIAEPPFAFS